MLSLTHYSLHRNERMFLEARQFSMELDRTEKDIRTMKAAAEV